MVYLLIQIGVGFLLAKIIMGRPPTSPSPARVLIASFAFGFLSLFFNAIMVLFQAVSSFFVVGLVAACGARRSIVVGSAVICALFGIGVNLSFQFQEYRRIMALRQDYPIVSLADRLSYETPHSEQATSEVALSENAIHQVESLEKEFDEARWSLRPHLLQKLHDDQYLAFVVAEGFGVVRMIRPNRYLLEIRKEDPEPLPPRPIQVDPPTAIQTPILAANESSNLTLPTTELHNSGVISFLSPERIGLIKSRQLVAGFEPHAMTRSPTQSSPRELAALADWQISRLDLVSLLKFAEPRVYLSEHLPRMEELRNAETRPVDEFEQQALQQLRDGEDIIVDQQLNTIRMVGAVRAAKQCLDCHSVRRGELLGAFSYLLDRKQPIPPPKVEAKPVSMRRRPSHDS